MKKNQGMSCGSGTCGFTLTETVVVLVIIAILAAVFIPSLTVWIDKAREKSLIAECRSCVFAAQLIAVEKYADSKNTEYGVTPAEIVALSETGGSVDYLSLLSDTADVDILVYSRDGYCVTYFRTPAPHYIIGSADIPVQEIGEGVSSGVDAIGGASVLLNRNIYSSDTSHPSYDAVLGSFPASIRIALLGKVWTLVPQSGEYILIIYDGTQQSLPAAGTRVDVSLYRSSDGSVTSAQRYVGTSGGKKVITSY